MAETESLSDLIRPLGTPADRRGGTGRPYGAGIGLDGREEGADLHWVVGSNTDHLPFPPYIIDLHRRLIVDIATAYLEEIAVRGAPSPINFVRGS